MSGRARHTLADGRRVTGYRKTLRRQSARAPKSSAALPLLELTFMLPPRLEFVGLKRGPFPGITGASIDIGDIVRITGASPDWLEQQAIKLVRQLAPDWRSTIVAKLTTPAEPLTMSGPMRPERTRELRLVIA